MRSRVARIAGWAGVIVLVSLLGRASLARVTGVPSDSPSSSPTLRTGEYAEGEIII